MEDVRSTFKIARDKPTGKIPSRRPRSRWEDNIRIFLKELVSIRRIKFIWLNVEIIGEPLYLRVQSFMEQVS